LTLAEPIVPGQWDPHAGASQAVDYSFLTAVYDSLVQLAPDMKTIEPMLATSWQLSSDGMSMTMNLRTDVTFQDGSQFDSSVVKANFDALMATSGYYAKQAAIVKSVTVLSPSSVQFTFNSAGNNFPLTVALYPGVGAMVSPKGLTNPAALKTTPAGSGPYELAQQSQNEAFYQKNPNYWNKQVLAQEPAKINIIGIPDDNARYAALQSGQVDAAAVVAPIPNITSIADGKNIKVAKFPGDRDIVVALNYKNPALAKLQVRQALSMAIDRQSIATSVVDGACTPDLQISGPGTAEYSSSAATPTLDVSGAQQLLKDAGVSGLNLKLETSQTPLTENLATAFQAEWKVLGINVSITPVPAAQALAAWRAGSYDLYLQFPPGNPNLGALINDNWATTNMPGGSDPQLIQMNNAAKNLAVGSPEEVSAYQALNKYVASNPVNLDVCNYPTQMLYKSYVSGVPNDILAHETSIWSVGGLAVLKH
jgi:peptide/nickel transport system substrate-binding protein